MNNDHGYNASELNWLNLYEELKTVARNHMMQSRDFIVWDMEEHWDITNNRDRNPIPLVNHLDHCTFTISYTLSRELDPQGFVQEFSVEYHHTQGVRARFLREPTIEFPLHIPCFAHNVAQHLGRFLNEISLRRVDAWNRYVHGVQMEEKEKRNLALFMAAHNRLGVGASGPLREILQDPRAGLYRLLIEKNAHHP